jgi:hypothetical protein
MDPITKSIVPGKFILMTCHLLSVLLIYDVSHENIVTGVRQSDTNNPLYTSANTE